jgi:3-hydroxybutyryl-CoA dehydrogenase
VIACGLAATAAAYTGEPVTVWARSPQSAERAFARITNLCQRFEPPAATAAVTMTTSHEGLAEATFVVEAIAEVLEEKTALLQALAPVVSEDAILASTTSSLSIEALATASGAPERFLGFHVFNPVTRMELVELVFPAQAAASTQARARDLCASLGKTAIEVPNTPGFVVNSAALPVPLSRRRAARTDRHQRPGARRLHVPRRRSPGRSAGRDRPGRHRRVHRDRRAARG